MQTLRAGIKMMNPTATRKEWCELQNGRKPNLFQFKFQYNYNLQQFLHQNYTKNLRTINEE